MNAKRSEKKKEEIIKQNKGTKEDTLEGGNEGETEGGNHKNKTRKGEKGGKERGK